MLAVARVQAQVQVRRVVPVSPVPAVQGQAVPVPALPDNPAPAHPVLRAAAKVPAAAAQVAVVPVAVQAAAVPVVVVQAAAVPVVVVPVVAAPAAAVPVELALPALNKSLFQIESSFHKPPFFYERRFAFRALNLILTRTINLRHQLHIP